MTGLSGQAIAAPVARGNPCPIDPPVKDIQSWGLALQVLGCIKNPDVAASSEMIDSSGSNSAIIKPMLVLSSSPVDGASMASSCNISLEIFFACLPIITPSSTSQSDFKEPSGKYTLSFGPQIELFALKNTIGSFGELASVSFA